MSDQLVAKWKQRGEVYCWRYRDNKRFPGWNLSADLQACESLVGLIDLMIASRYSSQATIRISPPTVHALNAVNRGEHWSSATELSLLHPKFKVVAGYWKLEASEARLAITVGKTRLEEIRAGVIDVSQGRGDWAAPKGDDTTDDAQLLYFWPLVWPPEADGP